MEKYIVDRILEDTVCLEDSAKKRCRVARSELPDGISEGQVLYRDADGWQINAAERDARRASVQRKLDALFDRRSRG